MSSNPGTTVLSPVKQALLALEEMTARVDALQRAQQEPIAIVGLACRFPGAPDAGAFWQLLREGRDAVGEIPRARWDSDALYDPDPDAPGRISTRWGGFLDEIDRFDSEFFGISPREAASMDPQQRLLLEVAWEALENAGQGPELLAASRTGVFVGLTGDEYAQQFLKAGDPSKYDVYFASGIARSVAGGRISYVLGVQGPNMAIDTACSSSLVAVHTACLHLRSGDCRTALAGGANVILSPEITMAFSKSHMMASDGRCKTFDARADGFVRAEGCGVVVLKRLSDAVADGDRVLAVIRGSAVNQDGRSSGLTAPSGPAQEAVIREALAKAQVDGSAIDYVEAHGTGTSLGDPIEAHALRDALGANRSSATPLVLGSVKTNVGHLEAAAGIAGLIKVVLSLGHEWIPAHLHYLTINPHIDWRGVPVDIPVSGRGWPRGGRRRLAGISAFGFSGTNAHVIVEEAPPEVRDGRVSEARPASVLALSARTESALATLAARYAAHVAAHPQLSLGDICYTTNTGRIPQGDRLAVVASTRDELIEKLSGVAEGRTVPGAVSSLAARRGRAKVAFLFTGQGAQYAGMGRQLYESEPVFRAAIDECERLLAAEIDRGLTALLWGEAADLIDQTQYTQPALFAVEWALAQLWRSWGVEPAVVLGHSVGEYVAACVAGVYSLADGLRFIAARGRLMGSLPLGEGTMAAILAPLDAVRTVVAAQAPDVDIAAVNGPENTVVAGTCAAVEAVAAVFEADGFRVERLRVSHAFHSSLMASVEEAFEAEAARMVMSAPRRLLVSSVTGAVATSDELADPGYWRRQARGAVQFHAALQTAAAQGCTVWVEIGPGSTLLGLARDVAEKGCLVPSLRRGKPESPVILESLGTCWTRGVPVAWGRFDEGRGHRRVALPSYPFERQRCWVEFTPARSAVNTAGHPLLGERVDVAGSPDLTIWRNTISTDRFPWLVDHEVHGLTILPMTAYLETMSAACRELDGNGPAAAVGDVLLRQPLVLERGNPVDVQVVARGGQLEIHSRRDGVWTLHASGRVGVAGDGSRVVPLDEIRSRLSRTLEAGEFYADLALRGHPFGPSFRGVAEISVGAGEALARVRPPVELVQDLTGYGAHPALLDACVQVLGAARPLEQGASYVPLALAEFVTMSSLRGDVWVHATVPAEPLNGVLDASIDVCDGSGRMLATLRRLELRRATGSSLSRAPATGSLFRLAWEEDSASVSSISAEPAVLASAVRPRAAGLVAEHALSRYDALRPALEALCVKGMADALIVLGVRLEPGFRFAERELIAASPIVDAQRRLFSCVLDMAMDAGLLRRLGPGTWEVACEPAPCHTTWAELKENFSEYAAEITLSERCVPMLADVLTGAADPLQLLFPGGSTAVAEQLYSASPSATVFNTLLADAVAAAAASASRPLRILEVGGGTGGSTTHVAPRLEPAGVEYTFTDVSPFFVARAGEKFARHGFMRFMPLDIERAPGSQGLPLGCHDVVIAANVLHATTDLRETLRHVRQLLAPGGLLVMLEVTHREWWIDLTFGMTDGWWRFTDRDLRKDYPLLDASAWQDLLSEQGFDAVSVIEAGAPSLNSVILSRAAGEAAPATADVLVIGGREHSGSRVAAALAGAGQPCTVAAIGDDLSTIVASRRWSHVIHAAALDAPELDAVAVDEVGRVQRDLCGSLIDVVRALSAVEDGDPPRLVVVTRGAQAVSDGERVNPVQAPLWGLMRTLAHEHPELRPTALDPDPSSIDALAGMTEIWRTDGESQIAWRDGRRFIARIEPASLHRDTPAAGRKRLSVSQRGVLENLTSASAVRRQPAAGQVEIAVDVAGLGFRDVLGVLGMYPGDPGPLGAECAGTVVSVGAGVTSLSSGDQVVAIAPGSHDGYVLADERLVARRPDGLGLHDAMTLPVPFLTAAFTLEHLARIRRGQRVLIHAGAGGVGLAAIQLAQRAGAEIFATAGTEEKRALLRRLGVPHVLSSRTPEFAEYIREATGGRGVDIVLNSLAGELVAASFSVIAAGGTFLEIGKTGIWTAEQAAALGRNITYHVVDWSEHIERDAPLLGAMLRRIVDDAAAGTLMPLPATVFSFAGAVDAFRYMAQGRHTGRILLAQDTAPPRVRRDGAYFVTGGTRGLGLEVAKWLVDAGARTLVLVARTGPSADAEAELDGLRSRGASVIVARADVSDPHAMQSAFGAIPGGVESLRGIVHAAGVLDDGVVLQQEWDRFARVMAPKMEGALNLHRLSEGAPLDFFVLFSSIASVLGGAGQGNHAAANAFEDALAHARRADGLPATSINWGAWAEIGSAARPDFARRRTQFGLDAFSPGEGMVLFEEILRAGPVQIGAARMDWGRFAEQWSVEARPAWLRRVSGRSRSPIVVDSPAAPDARVVSLRDELSVLAEGNRRRLLEERLQALATRILGMSSERRIDVRQPLNELGLDSLMAVEFRNALAVLVGERLPATLLFSYPAIDDLVRYVDALVGGQTGVGTAGKTPAPARPTGQAPADVLSAIDDLSDEEVDRLLAEKTGGVA